MASRQSLVAFVACALILDACTGTGPAEDPMASPDVFAPTPTIGELSPPTTARPAPTTTMDVERTVIYPVDPLTLDPLPGFEPISMQDWMSGRPSDDGAYFVATVGDDSGLSELRLVDVVDWELEGSWPESPESEVEVTDDGTVYFINSGQVHRLKSGYSAAEEVGRLPGGFLSWGIGALIDEALVVFGSRVGTELEHASIVLVDLTTGTVAEIGLPEVRIGQVDPSSEEPWSGYLYTTPSVVWDEATARALVLHGDENLVSEVDLASGVVSAHSFDADGVAGAVSSPMLQRSMALSPDGRHLYVSGRTVAGIDEEGESWTVSTAPTGVMSIDTTNWQVGTRVDEPIAEIYLSPDGDRILAWGYSTVEGNESYVTESAGLFVLDSSDLTVLAHHTTESQDQWYGPFSFNEQAGVGYVTVWRGRVSVNVIDLASGRILASIEGDESLDMIGSIGVLSTTSSS